MSLSLCDSLEKWEYLRSASWISLGLLLLLFDPLCFAENLGAQNPINSSLLSHQLRHVLPPFLFVGRKMCISFQQPRLLITQMELDPTAADLQGWLHAPAARLCQPFGEGTGLTNGGLTFSIRRMIQKHRVELAVMRKWMCQGKIVSTLCFERWWHCPISPMTVTLFLGAEYSVTRAFALFLFLCWLLLSKSLHSFKMETYNSKVILKKSATFHEDGH